MCYLHGIHRLIIWDMEWSHMLHWQRSWESWGPSTPTWVDTAWITLKLRDFSPINDFTVPWATGLAVMVFSQTALILIWLVRVDATLVALKNGDARQCWMYCSRTKYNSASKSTKLSVWTYRLRLWTDFMCDENIISHWWMHRRGDSPKINKKAHWFRGNIKYENIISWYFLPYPFRAIYVK
jgi:hypothetical protein